ncbi:uncharacterized protein LOC130950360 [Arachis stenosperma]|uniref:uncharacterized protein LOC130950360 n=1 Tax=Arachis stenosperma TaxID=217475 RepID=UPI0025ACE97F|nr:uncharacterized protein LOC130950360 [Arachis stenosperma]
MVGGGSTAVGNSIRSPSSISFLFTGENFATTSAAAARTPNNAALCLANLDSDGNHLLDFQDFMKFMTINKDDDLRKAFEMFVWEKKNTEASSSSSAITLKGLQQMLQQFGLESSYDDYIAMIAVFDINPN